MYLRVITTLAVIGCIAVLLAVRPFERAREDRHARVSPSLADARLDTTIDRLHLERASLADAVKVLRGGGANIVIDPAVDEIQSELDVVSLDLRQVRLSAALRLVLDRAGRDIRLDYGVRDGVIVISYGSGAEDVATTLRYYDVREFVTPRRPRPPSGDGEEEEGCGPADLVEQLHTLIKEEVDPDSWRDNGGSVGRLHYFNGLFVVRQTPENQRQIEELLRNVSRKSQTRPVAG